MVLISQSSPMPGNLACSAEGAVAPSRADLDTADIETLLDAIEGWPDLSEILFQRSLGLLARRGFSRWVSAGGTIEFDARPSFGNPSYFARRLLRHISARTAGFRYRDSNGLSWAVRLLEHRPGRPGSLRALALGCDLDIRLLGCPHRERFVRVLVERIQQMAPPASENEWRVRDRLRDRHRRLVLLGEAVALVPTLYASATRLGRSYLQLQVDELAAIVWGADRLHWPDDRREAVFQALACLGRLQVEVLELPMSGWAPRPTARTPAITDLSWLNRDTLSVHLGAMFVEFLCHMTGATVAPTVHHQD